MENTTTPAVTTTSVGLRYGLLTGIVSVIFSLILNISNLEDSPLKWLSFVILGVGILLASRFFKQANGGFMSYGQGLGIGAVLSGVVGVLSAIFTFIHINYMDTAYASRALEKIRASMEAQGRSEEQIEQGMAMTANFMTPTFLYLGAILIMLFFGFLLSLVIAAIVKNNRPEFE